MTREEFEAIEEELSAQRQPQPTAEGAEEILKPYLIRGDDTDFMGDIFFVSRGCALKAMQEFATLHAQRIADKMVMHDNITNDIEQKQCYYTKRHMKKIITEILKKNYPINLSNIDQVAMEIEKQIADKMVSERLRERE